MGERERIAERLTAIDGWIGGQGAMGVGAAVWWRGAVVAERYVGEARPGILVGPRTVFPLASVTKPVVAAAIMTLVEDGTIGLDEAVARFVPEFRRGPERDTAGVDPTLERQRQSITVHHLMCHVSGLPEDVGGREERFAIETSLDAIVDTMCHLPLQSVPGAVLRYSNAGYGVLGRLVERVAERSVWEIAAERIFAPLGLEDTLVQPGDDDLPRLARLADVTNAGTALEAYNGAWWKGLAVPWAGLYGSPRDLVTVAGAFLPNGPRVLSSAGVAAMTTDQTGGVPGGVESAKTHWPVGRWGLGWEVKGEKRRHWTGDLTSPLTFCHFGQAGTLLWADPAHDLALAVFANRAVSHMWTFILARWARLSNALVAAVS